MLQRLSLQGRGWIPGMLLIAVVALSAGCQDGLKAERNALRAENEELRNQLSSSRSALEDAEAARARLTERVANLEDKAAEAQNNAFKDIEGVESSASQGRVTVRVPGDVLFAPGQIEIKSSAKNTLSEIAGVLQSEYSGKTIRVEGYTDDVPISESGWDDNLQLSAERAMAVERYLSEQGVSTNRMYSAGFGSAKPRETKAKSRRVEIVVVMQPGGE